MALHHASYLIFVVESHFHDSQNPNATEIYKPIIGSYFILSYIIETLESLEKIIISMETKPEAKVLQFILK